MCLHLLEIVTSEEDHCDRLCDAAVATLLAKEGNSFRAARCPKSPCQRTDATEKYRTIRDGPDLGPGGNGGGPAGGFKRRLFQPSGTCR